MKWRFYGYELPEDNSQVFCYHKDFGEPIFLANFELKCSQHERRCFIDRNQTHHRDTIYYWMSFEEAKPPKVPETLLTGSLDFKLTSTKK